MERDKTMLKNNCPNDEVFIKAFTQQLSIGENERLIDHILVCKKCHKKFAILKQLSLDVAKKRNELSEEKLSIEEEKQLRKLYKQKLKEIKRGKLLLFNMIPTRYVALTGILILAIAGIFFISKIEKVETLREKEKVELNLMKPVGKISGLPVIFSWTAYEGVDDYRFRLIDDDLNTIYEIAAFDNQLTLPDEVSQLLKKGKTYIWKVEARDTYGNVLSSDFTSFELR